MDYSKVLKQAWKNVISYRALWIFGVLLALTTASGSGTTLSQNAWRTDAESTGILGTGITLDVQPGENWIDAAGDAWAEAKAEIRGDIAEANQDLTRLFREELGLDWRVDILRFFTVMLWIALVLFIVGRVLHYMSDASLIKMVDDQEQTGEKRSVGEGFGMGWSLASWRLFLIDLVVDIPAAIVFLVLFALVFAPLLLWGFGISEIGWLSVAFTSGSFFLFIFLAIVAGQAIGLLKRFAKRVCALEDAGVFESIRRGFTLLRRQIKEAGLVWLILVGVNIGYPILVGLVAILLVAVGIVVGGGLGLLSGLTANAIGAAKPVLTGFAVGVPLFLLLIILPLIFLDGLKMVFTSSTWTLTFREIRALAGLKAEALPEPKAKKK
jgi:hypothetical protein